MRTQTKRLYRQLLVAALLMGGTFNMTAPVLALGTAAGTGIVNRATATYEDPNNAGTTINATSNTVSITVAEVAGITVITKSVTDTTPSTPVATGDRIDYIPSFVTIERRKAKEKS